MTADKDSFFNVIKRSGQILTVIETQQENMETILDGVKEENGNSRASLQGERILGHELMTPEPNSKASQVTQA